ncbi:MAG: hypothetical protein ACQXXF_08125 [Thermoplasmatota archaeon]
MKKIIQTIIVIFFLNLVLTPNINAINYNCPDLEIEYVDQTGSIYYVSLNLSIEQIQKFKNVWVEWENYLKNIREDNQMDYQETLEFEKKSITLLEEIKNLTRDPTTNQFYFPSTLEISNFIHSHLFMTGFGARIFSIGRGRVWLPFNRQGETFIGLRFNPIFVSYIIGFTRVKVRSLSTFSMVVSNRFFVHRVCTAGFSGLYINFKKLFPDNSIGPVILIGKPLLINVGDDLF